MVINQFDINNKELLISIQGNILKGHGREHTANLFIKGKINHVEDVKTWLRSLVSDEKPLIKSCYEQLRSSDIYKRKKIDSGLFACVHISAKGYGYLFGEQSSEFVDLENTFKNGIKEAELNDPVIGEWDNGLNDDAHFLLILADSCREKVDDGVELVKKSISSFADIVFEQEGDVLKNEEGAGIEHFGYVDGISQPLFFEDEINEYRKQNNIPFAVPTSYFAFDPSAEVGLVLAPDPFAQSSNAKGSYLVFRKLEQDVEGFKKAEEELARKLGLSPEDEERAGAMLVGRFEDGTPIQLSKEDGMIGSDIINNFDYVRDDESKCPYHAHIRKTNPRSDSPNSKSHIMARRGIPYGERTATKKKGLLFMSYQASIVNQFEVIQRFWANSDTFVERDPKDKVGIDPITGQSKSKALGAYATNWNDPKSMQQESFAQFVTMKGGGYFFAPSMDFLKNL